jgi:hypothetical protein
MTTMTQPMTAAAPVDAPPFTLQPAEGWTERGQRAVLYLLTHGEFSTFRLDDDTLEAAYHGAGIAATGRQLPADVAETLATLERSLRQILAARRRDRAERDARLQAMFDAADAAQLAAGAPIEAAGDSGSQGPSAGSQGSGGSKVPNVPRPKPGAPPAAVVTPPAPPVPQVPIYVPAPALSTVSADDLF